MKKSLMNRAARSIALLALAAGLAGCAVASYAPPPPEPLPRSHWNGQFVFRINLPPPVAATHDVNVAVVNPYYKEEESALLAANYTKVGKGFSASMGADLEKLLIAKGLTATGPFATTDDITYAEKKGILYVAIVGENEMKERKVTLKRMGANEKGELIAG